MKVTRLRGKAFRKSRAELRLRAALRKYYLGKVREIINRRMHAVVFHQGRAYGKSILADLLPVQRDYDRARKAIGR